MRIPSTRGILSLACLLLFFQPVLLHAQVDLYIGGDIVLSGIGDTLYVKGNVIYNAGSGKMNQVANSALYFTGNFNNNNLTQLPFYVDANPLLRSRGDAYADQGFAQNIGGAGKINFYSLAIKKVLHTQSVTLTNEITIHHKLRMLNGDLNVANRRVIFNSKDTASYILGETDLNRIFGSTGYLQVKRFSNSAPIAPARLGLSFNGLQDSVLVKRFFLPRPNAADGSIERWYQVRSANASVQFAQATSTYLDSTETNTHGQEANFRIFKSNDAGSTWTRLTSTPDTTLDQVTAPAMAGTTTDTLQYTIADYDCANPPADTLPADTAFCLGDSVLLHAGTGPGYTYLWSTGATTPSIHATQTDTIWVQVSDPAGCTTTDTIRVTEQSPPFVMLALGQPSISGCPGATITLDAGNPGMAFLWSTAATTQTIALTHSDTALVLQPIWVDVTDTNGCTARDSVTYRHVPGPSVELGPARNICGGNNVVLDAAMPGPSGNAGATYLWSIGSTASQITVGTTALYSVTVTNSGGCTAADTVAVNAAPAISATLSPTDITCNGAANGSITPTVTGGTPGFSYLWSNGATTAAINGLSPATYTLTVTDALGCQATASTPITQPAPLTATATHTNITCFGAADGTAAINATGGTFPYTYTWSTGATTPSISTLPPGTYTVTITDANGCTTIRSRTITEPSPVTISLNALTPVACAGGSNGSIDIQVTGGTGTYAYNWSNGATTQDINALPPGSYTLIAQDGSACADTMTFSVGAPSPIALSATTTDATCNAAATASIDLSPTGGTSPFTYQWSQGATTQDLSAIPAGTYAVTVTDANGCTATLTDSVTQPAAITLNIRSYDASCGQSDGAVAITATGGTAPFTYAWPAIPSTLDSVPNLPAGTYQAIVTDANGCVDSATTAINNIGAATITLDSLAQVSCFGGANGYIAVSLSGGQAPFSYLWSNGATTGSLSGISTGTYNLTVTGSDNCIATFTQTITQPSALSATAILSNATCGGTTDGAIDFIPSGGTLPYTYSWTYTGGSASTQDLGGIGAGQYHVLLTDSSGCTLQDSFSITEPAAIVLSHSTTAPLCNGNATGAIDLSVSGGTAPYTFAWSNGQISEDLSAIPAGQYTVTVTDLAGCAMADTATITEPTALLATLDTTHVLCNGGSDGTLDLSVTGGTTPYTYAWSNLATTPGITNLTAGLYEVVVTDANGCDDTLAGLITEPALLTYTLVATDVHCGGANTGTATILASGGTGAYTYAWSNADTSATATDLAAGTYTVTLSDANGCQASGSITVIEPPTLSFAATVTDVTCRNQADGLILVSPFGGSTPYTYAWSTGDTTPDLIGIGAGTYILALTDSAGCTFRDTLTVVEGDSALQARFLVASIVNSEDTIQFLEFSIPYPDSIRWDFGDGSTSNQPYPTHVYADNLTMDTSYYQVKLVVSNAWCTDSITKTITVVNSSGKTNQGPGQNGIGDILNAAVYPNPNMGTFFVDLALRKSMNASVQVIDLHGRRLIQQDLQGEDHYHLELNLDHRVAAGVYLVSIQADKSQKIVRIVKF